MNIARTLSALACAACLVLPAAPAAAAIHLELGDASVVEGGIVTLPFTLTLDEDLFVAAIDGEVAFDTTRLSIDMAAPMMGSLSFNDLGALPDWVVNSDALGVVFGGPPDPALMTAATPYTGVLTFTGLLAGPDPVPVVATMSICDFDNCFFSDPIVPQMAQATGHVTVTAIPEPPRWALAGAGLMVMGLLARRRRHD